MSDKLPSSLAELVLAWPPRRKVHVEQILAGDLELGVRQYAERGGYHGDKGEWWRIWQQMQHLRGLFLAEALEELTPEQRRWFARWAFANGEVAEAMVAYRRYLDEPGKIGPFERENTVYLDCLAQQGRHQELLDTVEELVAAYDDVPTEEMRAARASLALGDSGGAVTRLAAVWSRHHDSGDVWALTAVVAVHLSDNDLAQRAANEAAKLGVDDPGLERELLRAMKISLSEWQARRAPFALQPRDYEDGCRQWWSDPGARFRSANRVSPHWYGGDEFRMPPCLGCGHLIRQWFVLDITQIAPLHRRLPSWRLFPLLGCVDCLVGMGRHDYEVDANSLNVRLVNLTISRKRYGKPLGTFPIVPKQFVDLEWIQPKRDPSEEDMDEYLNWERPQVAGTPAWTQQPLRVFCRSCREEMTFVAAMASTIGFEPEVPINNESGFQYHFACDACHTISVIAQWT